MVDSGRINLHHKKKIMRIAVTCQNKKTVSGHAGKCSRFLIYTLDEDYNVVSKEMLELEKERMLHFHFHGPDPDAHHPLFDMNAIITGDMGPGFPIKMRSKGVAAIMTTETDPDRVIERLKDGTLDSVQPAPNHNHHH